MPPLRHVGTPAGIIADNQLIQLGADRAFASTNHGACEVQPVDAGKVRQMLAVLAENRPPDILVMFLLYSIEHDTPGLRRHLSSLNVDRLQSNIAGKADVGEMLAIRAEDCQIRTDVLIHQTGFAIIDDKGCGSPFDLRDVRKMVAHRRKAQPAYVVVDRALCAIDHDGTLPIVEADDVRHAFLVRTKQRRSLGTALG